MSKIISLSALSAINPNDLFYVSTSLSADRKATAAVLLSFITQNLSSLSANNASVFNTVNTNSATNWNYQGTDIKALSAFWHSTYTQFRVQSADNTSVYSSVNAQSANNASVYSSVNAQSANNASVFNTVNTNSATNWNYQGNDVKALTGNWQASYTALTSTSANWNDARSIVQTNSGTNWNYQGTDIKALTSNWQNTYATVSSTSGSWLQTLSFNSGNAQLSISGGNTISLSSLSASGGSLPTGGTTNQILVKNSATNNDASWKNKRITLTLPTLSTTGTLSSNALSADQFVVSLSGASTSATIGAPISAYDAQIIMWNIRYSSNIAAVLLASSFRTPATTLNWSISTNKMDIMAAKYNLLDSKWDVISFAPGYQL
jgi:hypothetical protein